MKDTHNDTPEDGIEALTGRGLPLGPFLQRASIITLFVALATVVVLSLKLLCALFGGLLLGAFLIRFTQHVQRLTKWPYGITLAVIWLIIIGLLFGVGYLFGTQLASQVDGLVEELQQAVENITSMLKERGWLAGAKENFPEIVSQSLQTVDTAAFFGGVFSSVGSFFTSLAIILFVGFFLAVDPGIYRRGLLTLVPKRRRQWAGNLLSECIDTLWWWMLGRLFAMVVVGFATAIGLWVLGVPMPVMLGIVAGLLSFVPTIGAVLGVIPALLVSIQQGFWTPIYVLALYVGIQAVENNLLTPLIQQRAVNVPPVLLITSQLLLGILVGLIGVAIAAPVAAIGIVLVLKLYVEPIAEQ